MIELIPESGKFYKVNLHCHTNISDGADSREAVKEFYKSNGYSAVCFTDHEVLLSHKDLCDEDFVALHGYEVAVKQDIHQHTGWFMPVYHFNMIAKDPNNLKMPRFFSGTIPPIREMPGSGWSPAPNMMKPSRPPATMWNGSTIIWEP